MEKDGNMVIWLNIIVSILFFFEYLSSGNELYIFVILAMFITILIFIVRIKDYSSKVFYRTFLGIVLLQGLTLTYLYIFEPFYRKELLFYVAAVIFTFLIILFIYYYIKRGKYSKLPWEV